MEKHGRSGGIRTHDPFTPSDVPEENMGNYSQLEQRRKSQKTCAEMHLAIRSTYPHISANTRKAERQWRNHAQTHICNLVRLNGRGFLCIWIEDLISRPDVAAGDFGNEFHHRRSGFLPGSDMAPRWLTPEDRFWSIFLGVYFD